MQPGADKQAYAQALADIDPINLQWVGLISSEQDTYQPAADYMRELSGDKLTFELDYGYAKVPGPDVGDALALGRADMGMYIPAYNPEKWPVTNLITGLTTMSHPNALVGRLATFAAQTEFALGNQALYDEAQKNGIVPVFPIYTISADQTIACRDNEAPTSLDDLNGKQIAVPSKVSSDMVHTVGATPVSMTGPEFYEALQRGVVDCSIQALTISAAQGFEQITKGWAFGSEAGAGVPSTPVGWGFSKRTWDSMPLAAQQLVWDSQAKISEDMLTSLYTHFAEMMQRADEAGVDVAYLDDDANEALAAFSKQYAENAATQLDKQGLDGQAMLGEINGLYDKWWTILTEELGFDADTQWSDLTTFATDPTAFDIAGFIERFNDEVLAPNRPGSSQPE